MDPSLLLGALLVGVGLALAALAYSLITERTSADKETDGDTPAETTDDSSQDDTSPTEVTQEDDAEEAEEAAGQEEELPSPEGELETETEKPVEVESPGAATAEEPSPIDADTAPKPEPPKVRPTFTVATMMRDEVSGALVIQVGEVIYRSKEELLSSKDWGRVSFAADDLAKWMVGDPTGEVSARPPSARRTPSGKAERSKESVMPRSMVEEIDDILQEMLLDSSHKERAVRLLEGPGGMARVLIGIDSYSIEEVPDSEIKELIKQAVATWEATR